MQPKLSILSLEIHSSALSGSPKNNLILNKLKFFYKTELKETSNKISKEILQASLHGLIQYILSKRFQISPFIRSLLSLHKN